MNRDQLLPALMAALMGEGVTIRQIERSVSAVRGLPLGASIPSLASPAFGDQSLVRAFVDEQTRLLERS